MRPRPAVYAAALVAGLALVAPTPAPGVTTATPPAPRLPIIRLVPAGVETAPVAHSGDAADDPAIWVDPDTPGNSLIIGNNKKGALEVYGLDGELRQRITTGTTFWGNVDVRQGVIIGAQDLDLVATYNGGLRFYVVDPATRMLTPATDGNGTLPTQGGEGLCLYASQTGVTHAFVVTRKGRIREYLVHDQDNDGLLQISLERQFALGSEGEGCAVDDAADTLYASEEEVGLWRFAAGPNDPTTGTLVDRVAPNGNLVPDVEGVTIVDDYVIASAQHVAAPKQSYFTVYDRQTNAFVDAFRISASTTTDGCQRTDGIAAYAGSLGPSFPQGVFVCQDNSNSGVGADGNQDFKLTRLETVVDLS